MSKLKKAPSSLQNKKQTKISPIIKWGIVLLGLTIILLLVQYFKNLEPNKPETQTTTFPFTKQGELAFVSATGDTISQIDVEVAETTLKRNQGLMYRTQMSDKQGMIFIFDVEEEQSFWMKNTYLPLDMMFVNSENTIVKIHRNTEPLTTTPYSSGKPAQFVVEVIGGYSDKFGVKEGDKIRWKKL